MAIVAVSGGFIILHHGHTRLIEAAAEHGQVVVILNSDEWQQRKYGKVIVPYAQREEVLLALKHVYNVIPAHDEDGSVCETLKHLKPDFFANGGDRWKHNTPECDVCRNVGIKPLWNIGGDKIASSSAIMGRAHV